jgi:hypothetical protein
MIVVGIVSIACGVGMLFLFGTFSTRYAPGYSESGFRRIRSGMGSNDVLRLVGKPLNFTDAGYYGEYWWYTAPDGKRFKHWKLRMLRITNGVVADIDTGVTD